MDKLMSAAGASNVNKKSDTIELLPHNQMLYDKIVAEMEEGERSIFYSEATGLGKSFIFMRLVQDYFVGKKILYVVPKIAIWKNLTRYKEFNYLNADIVMTTYAAFNNYDRSLCNEYDVVFVDECHHMLSDIQGSNLHKFCKDMNAIDKYSFGFTATPYYKGTYVDEECFNVSCYGYDVCEAINLGILPKIHFSVANINIDDIPMDMRIRYSITGTKTLLEQLLERNADKNKWIAYFLNKVELEQNMHELKTLFPDYTILKVYDGIDDEDNVYDTFNNSTGKVILLSVNKLLEGVHLNGVQGVLLYRNVTEFSTYMQMYGRLCDISANESPIFLDVANAIFSINKFSEYIFKSNRCGNKVKRRIRDFFDVYAEDYWTVELSEILRAKHSNFFTEEDDAILTENAPNYTLAELCKLIPNHSRAGIQHRLNMLGLACVQRASMSDEDKEIIKLFYATEGSKCKYRLSKEYSTSYVSAVAQKLGVSYADPRTWDSETVKKLIDLHSKGVSHAQIGEILGRDISAISSAISRYCTEKKSIRNFSDDEKKLIEHCVNEGLSYNEITERINMLPENTNIPRTQPSVRCYVRMQFGSQSKRVCFSDDDIAWLRENSSKYTLTEMIDIRFHDMSESTLVGRIRREGLTYRHVEKSDYNRVDAEQYVLKSYTISTIPEMAEVLGISTSTVRNIMRSLGVTSPLFTPWSEKELLIARNMRSAGATYKDIGEYLHRHKDSVASKLKRVESLDIIDIETYRGVLLRNMNTITVQFGVSHYVGEAFKKKTQSSSLRDYVDYLYKYLLDKGMYKTEDEIYDTIQRNRTIHSI